MASESQPLSGTYEAARTLLTASLRDVISDRRVLDAFAKVPRELFVPVESRSVAYADRPLPIGHGQTISQPRMVAIMLQELALKGNERVLDVGTGSGYQAALLAELTRTVTGVELIPELTERARRSLAEAGYDNVIVHVAGDELGWPQDAPYDAIVVGAASPRVPQSLTAQLAQGGRLVLPVGPRDSQELMVVENRPEGLTVIRQGPCGFVPLIGREAFPSAPAESTDART
jgi:protein-L-isoaspartate(D-aspartate) O-methyltransferase